MKKRAILLIVEAAAADLAAAYLFWRVYDYDMPHGTDVSVGIPESGILIMAIVFSLITLLVCLQGYFLIIRPYSVRVSEMEKAVEESRKAEAIRKEFVANVSHELKTPLTSISGFIETLQDGAAEDPEIRTKFIDIIAIETSRLKRLISDLLVLSDIENKRVSGGDAFNVADAVESTVETLRPLAGQKNIEIQTELDRDMMISGSVDRFRQMMVNLIENAIKYSDEGGHVLIRAFYEDGRRIVSVKDEGIGIAPEHHDRLFERFYRVDKSRSKKAGGTGLGLSIVKHIAVLLGAGLKVESRVGEGSEFFVIFEKEE